jgi:hypothetical protein
MWISNISNALHDWWSKQGFVLVREEAYGPYGMSAEFSLGLNTSAWSFTDSPVTERNEKLLKVEQMKAEGWDIREVKEESEPVLVDNDQNRRKVIDLFKTQFPSCIFHRIENLRLSRSSTDYNEMFRLWEVKLFIKDYGELQRVYDQMKDN